MPLEISVEDASEILSKTKRVVVIGVSGGGKSTLSRAIEKKYGLPHISIDRDIRWLPGWEVRDRAEQRRLTEHFAAQDRWVIDGTTVSSFDLRVPRADLVVWIRSSRRRALWQLAKRVWGSYGKVRPDMAEDCREKLPDREFLEWIWTFEKRQSPRIIGALAKYGADTPLVILRTSTDANTLLHG